LLKLKEREVTRSNQYPGVSAGSSWWGHLPPLSWEECEVEVSFHVTLGVCLGFSLKVSFTQAASFSSVPHEAWKNFPQSQWIQRDIVCFAVILPEVCQTFPIRYSQHFR